MFLNWKYPGIKLLKGRNEAAALNRNIYLEGIGDKALVKMRLGRREVKFQSQFICGATV